MRATQANLDQRPSTVKGLLWRTTTTGRRVCVRRCWRAGLRINPVLVVLAGLGHGALGFGRDNATPPAPLTKGSGRCSSVVGRLKG